MTGSDGEQPWWTREWESSATPGRANDNPWASAPPPAAGEQAWRGAPPPDELASNTLTSWPAPRTSGPRQPGSGGRARLALLAVVVVALMLASGALGGLIGAHSVHLSDTASTGSGPGATTASIVAKQPAAGQTQIEAVAAAVAPSVVLITETTPSLTGTGSGVIIRSDGYILTNNHVVSDFATTGGTLTVTLSDGKTVPATIVGRDPSSDLAVVKINPPVPLLAARLGNSANALVGETVLAFGSPLGLQSTVTEGIVSALNRPVYTGDESVSDTNAVIDAIQTDAAINPGNSGGPLVDTSGDVIGIDSAIATLSNSSSGQSGSIGIGFAIPIDSARTVAEQLITLGHAIHAELGVEVADAANNGGAVIEQVKPGSGAARAGLQAGDVVTAVDGQQVINANALVVAVRNHNPGQSVTLTFRRGASTHSATVVLGSVIN